MNHRYIIEPAFAWWLRESYVSEHGARPVDEAFRYASNSNTDWLSEPDIKALLAEEDA